jgi:hypothetical protein
MLDKPTRVLLYWIGNRCKRLSASVSIGTFARFCFAVQAKGGKAYPAPTLFTWSGLTVLPL